MDQNSFRRLISTPGGSGSGSRGNVSTKSKTVDAAQPLFKPRKLKKADTEVKYRDRAAERREGGGNDYAHVEAVLRDFEQRNATNKDRKTVEEQRKYLGGDSEHSILVKGLDIALLEQKKARAALDSTEDDDILEEAYLEGSFLPQRRTREDLIKELKHKRTQHGGGSLEGEPKGEAKRTAQEEARALEEAKKQGKFKPLGFKPIGGPEKEKKKKKKVKTDEHSTKEGEERKKKKRKVEGSETDQTQDKTELESTKEIPTTPPAAPIQQPTQSVPGPEPEPLGDDFDIFAGAGDYDGVDLGDDDNDDDDDDEADSKPTADYRETSQTPPPTGNPPRKWISTEEDEVPSLGLKHTEPQSPSRVQERRNSARKPDGHDVEMEDGETRELEEEQTTRLQPLESSNLPSIREFLAMDEAAVASEKRRKRKEKKKAGGGAGGSKSLEQKVNRDFQRLQSYTNKKEASGLK